MEVANLVQSKIIEELPSFLKEDETHLICYDCFGLDLPDGEWKWKLVTKNWKSTLYEAGYGYLRWGYGSGYKQDKLPPDSSKWKTNKHFGSKDPPPNIQRITSDEMLYKVQRYLSKPKEGADKVWQEVAEIDAKIKLKMKRIRSKFA